MNTVYCALTACGGFGICIEHFALTACGLLHCWVSALRPYCVRASAFDSPLLRAGFCNLQSAIGNLKFVPRNFARFWGYKSQDPGVQKPTGKGLQNAPKRVTKPVKSGYILKMWYVPHLNYDQFKSQKIFPKKREAV